MQKLSLTERLAKWTDAALAVNQLIDFASRIDPFANSDLGQAEPADKLDGLLAYADGSTWNPGLGKGLHRWDSVAAAWVNFSDHSSLVNLAADDHTQYALLAGRAGGQILRGGTASGDKLYLRSTSHATPGAVVIEDGFSSYNATLNTEGFAIRRHNATQTHLDFKDAGVINIDTANGGARVLNIRGDGSTTANILQVKDTGLIIANTGTQTGYSLLYGLQTLSTFEPSATPVSTLSGISSTATLGQLSVVPWTDEWTSGNAGNFFVLSFANWVKSNSKVHAQGGTGGFLYLASVLANGYAYSHITYHGFGQIGYVYHSSTGTVNDGTSFLSKPIIDGNGYFGRYSHFQGMEFLTTGFGGTIYENCGVYIPTLIFGTRKLGFAMGDNESYHIGSATFGSDLLPSQLATPPTIAIVDDTSVDAEKVTNGAFTGSATGWTLGGTGVWAYSSNTVVKNGDGVDTLTQPAASMVGATAFAAGDLVKVTYLVKWQDKTANFTAATTDICTSTAHGLSNGDLLMLSSTGTLPAGLTTYQTFFVINVAANTFKLSLTSGGAAVDITDTGTGTHTFTLYDPTASLTLVLGGTTGIVRHKADPTYTSGGEEWCAYSEVISITDTTGIIFTPSSQSRFTIDTVSMKKITGGILYIHQSIAANTDSGLKIGTATTQKLGFYNTTPVDQPDTVADADGTLADATTKINTIIDRLQELGLIA